jgi:hypothetical protein
MSKQPTSQGKPLEVKKCKKCGITNKSVSNPPSQPKEGNKL